MSFCFETCSLQCSTLLSQQHQNIQLQQDMMVEELELCDDNDEPKCCDGSCDQSCEHEEEEQPLVKTNNYQFC